MSIKIKELPELERPYEKLELYGENALSNAELLAIIIKTGTKEETSVQLAQRILKLNNNEMDGINFLRNITIQELIKIKGIGRVKAIQLKAVGELANRMVKPTNYQKVKVKTPDDVAKIMMEELRFQKNEVARVVILNNKNEIIKIKDISFGGTNFANLKIKNIVELPIKLGASKIILVHNHPSGDSTPSTKDIEFTEYVYDAISILGIELLDHIVIGNNTYTSIFSEMLKQQKIAENNEKVK